MTACAGCCGLRVQRCALHTVVQCEADRLLRCLPSSLQARWRRCACPAATSPRRRAALCGLSSAPLKQAAATAACAGGCRQRLRLRLPPSRRQVAPRQRPARRRRQQVRGRPAEEEETAGGATVRTAAAAFYAVMLHRSGPLTAPAATTVPPAADEPAPPPPRQRAPAAGGGGGGGAPVPPSCYQDPGQQRCRTFQHPAAEAVADIRQLCASMPLVGCSLWAQCSSGAATGGYCQPFSVLGSICQPNSVMAGCQRWAALCTAQGSVVQQCITGGASPCRAGAHCNTPARWLPRPVCRAGQEMCQWLA